MLRIAPARARERNRSKFSSRFARQACAIAALFLAGAAQAQTWPTRSVRFVLPFGAGSATDAAARLLQERLTTRWGQPVVVENRPGGDGFIAINGVTQAADPQVLLFASSSSLIAHPYQHEKLPYDLKRDLEPIARIANTILVVAVPTSLDVGSIKDMVAQARAQPGKFNFAGAPGLPLLTLSSFVKSEKLDVTLVPYRDIVQAATDLGENRLQLLVTSLAIVQPLVEAGKIKVLAVTSRERSAVLQNAPTVAEEGFAGLELASPTGLFGPRGMPLALRERIARDISEALSDPSLASRIALTGQNVSPGGPAELAHALDEQAARAAEVAKVLGLGPGGRPATP